MVRSLAHKSDNRRRFKFKKKNSDEEFSKPKSKTLRKME